ncbi:MAG: hypothetical protein ACT4OY_08105 [Alphaproteobacteria bacterium]
MNATQIFLFLASSGVSFYNMPQNVETVESAVGAVAVGGVTTLVSIFGARVVGPVVVKNLDSWSNTVETVKQKVGCAVLLTAIPAGIGAGYVSHQYVEDYVQKRANTQHQPQIPPVQTPANTNRSINNNAPVNTNKPVNNNVSPVNGNKRVSLIEGQTIHQNDDGNFVIEIG